ncbi:MAG: methionine adenosyltransferase [Aigarchaeota archaeon]|nr:methionine adenosyltransferase [Aigarchaeota archaeon]MDW8093160.1 methionine adenosyltransferase [Nitrososphaerota archaeon]
MDNTLFALERLKAVPVSKQTTELVERKGLGHPDYMIDSVCEIASIKLAKYYLERFGRILHYNVDKGLLVGGRAVPRFGGGELLEPIQIIVAGRATLDVRIQGNRYEVPIRRIIEDAVDEFINSNFRFLDPQKHIVVDYRIKQGSADLVSIVDSGTSVPLANDTSFGIGFAPFTTLERIVYNTERMINSESFKSRVKESGEDCKVMGLRVKERIMLTVADGIVSHLTPDLDHYISVKEEIRERVADEAVKMADGHDVSVQVNVGDEIMPGDEGRSRVYLTVTGSSAECGDDGNTGRGNRASGLITPNRQMSLEATAGKNPMSHIGKLYNVAAFRIAERIYDETKAFEEVYVRLLSQIGRRVDQPFSVSIQYLPARTINSSVKSEVESIVRSELQNVTKLVDLILERRFTIF